jgi:hypothetical protein
MFALIFTTSGLNPDPSSRSAPAVMRMSSTIRLLASRATQGISLCGQHVQSRKKEREKKKKGEKERRTRKGERSKKRGRKKK